MRYFSWLLTGVIILGAVTPSLARSWPRLYRRSSSYYAPAAGGNYLPPGYGSPSPYGYPPMGQPNPGLGQPAAPDDGRHAWIYGSQREGSFVQQPTGLWVESNPSGRFVFQEVARTPDFIELFDPSRGAFARLTDGMMYHHGPLDPFWHPGHQGTWR